MIMLTGHGALPSAEEAYVSGAFDYLAKPCDIELLAKRIEDASHHRGKDQRCEGEYGQGRHGSFCRIHYDSGNRQCP